MVCVQNIQTYVCPSSLAIGQARLRDRQTDTQTDRQLGRLTETETDILVSQLVGDGEGQVESVVLC